MNALRLWRQRRRIILTTAIAIVAGLVMFGMDWRGPVGLGLLFAVLTSIIVTYIPDLRWFIVKSAIILTILAIIHSATDANPVFLLIAGLIGAVVLPSQLYWLDDLRRRGIDRAQVTIEISRSIDTVWRAVRPVPGGPYWDPAVTRVSIGQDPDGLILTRRMPDGTDREIPLQLLDVAPLRYLKVRDRSLPSVADGGPVTVTAFRLDGDPEHCTLTIFEATWRAPVWLAIELWFDDYLADHADHMAALIEERPDPSLKGAMQRSTLPAQRS